MMKIIKLIVIGIFLVCQGPLLFSKDISPLQLLFTVKQIFPDCKEVAILITKDLLKQQEQGIARGSAQTQIKVKVFVIKGAKDIGGALKQTPEGGVIIVFSSGKLSDSKSKLFILSKAKPKNIAVVTSSLDYSQSGALLGVVRGEDNKVKMILNLQHNGHLKSTFTPELIQKVGIQQVIE